MAADVKTRMGRRSSQLHPIPSILRPILRAYILGYATAAGPRLLTLLIQLFIKKQLKQATFSESVGSFLESLQNILHEPFGLTKFPAFCAFVVGGRTVLDIAFRSFLSKVASTVSATSRTRLSSGLSTFIAAGLSLRLLQSRKSSSYAEIVSVRSDQPPGVEERTIHYAGRTLDLTLFTAARALDIIVGDLWFRRPRSGAQSWTRVEKVLSNLIDPAVFSVSCAAIMWGWFYYPEQLPKAYRKWITSAANVDKRLVKALQEMHHGSLRYGEDTGRANLLQSMCADYDLPIKWGDPTVSVPFPCELVHMGCGPSCEYHAFRRFYKSSIWALCTYLPLNLCLQLRNPTRKGLERALISSARSSAFLGTFIAIFYYGICLTRTRLGPYIIGKDIKTRQVIDSGICIGVSCFICGWSVLIENPKRRKELALFVAPRALATVFPRKYSLDKEWRETAVFAVSMAVMLTCLEERPERIRGALGKVLPKIMAR